MAMTDCRRHLLSSWGRRRRLSEYFLRRLDRQSGQSCPRDALPKILQIVPIFVVGIFEPNSSSTWTEKGIHTLPLEAEKA
jgi:hypothetical protein